MADNRSTGLRAVLQAADAELAREDANYPLVLASLQASLDTFAGEIRRGHADRTEFCAAERSTDHAE